MNAKCAAAAVTVILGSACIQDRDDERRTADLRSAFTCTPEWCVSARVPWAGHDLQAVWTGAPGEAWVLDLFGRVFHYDARGWTAKQDLDWFGGTAVWGASTVDVWALGDYVRHWDGASWTTWQTDDSVSATWKAIWGRASNDIWIGGGGGALEHWDGSVWTSFGWSHAGGALPYTDSLMGIWGSSTSDVWIVGDFGYSHWDGLAVSYPTRTLSQITDAIWGFARDDVWVVGQFGMIGHFDGITWSELASPTSKDLAGIWGSAPNDIWAVGDAGTILHWDGTQWAVSPSGVDDRLRGIWGTGSGDVWATGSTVILHHGT